MDSEPFFIIKGLVPSDVFADILARLPARLLLCCRAVAKNWCALIDQPWFMQKQLRKSESTRCLSLLIGGLDHGDTHYLELNLDHGDIVAAEVKKLEKFPEKTQIVASCRGLVCFHNPISRETLVWNPSTRNKFRIPPAIRSKNSYVDSVFGLGYDDLLNDYQLIEVSHTFNFEVCGIADEIQVYSFRTNSWKEVEFPFSIRSQGTWKGVFARGAFHFVCEEDEGYFILAFNLREQSFEKVPQPTVAVTDEFELYSLNEQLAAVSKFSQIHLSIWCMMDDKGEGSWAKIGSLTMENPDSLLVPIVYYDSKILMLENESRSRLYWLETSNCRITHVESEDLPPHFDVIPFIDSILLPVQIQAVEEENRE